MLLHLSRQSVQVTGPCVWRERLPVRKCRPGGFDSSIDICNRPWRHTGELLGGGGVGGVEVLGGSGLQPHAIDEVAEASSVVVEPGKRLFRIFWRWAVLHRDESF